MKFHVATFDPAAVDEPGWIEIEAVTPELAAETFMEDWAATEPSELPPSGQCKVWVRDEHQSITVWSAFVDWEPVISVYAKENGDG